ncbi:hypothetical protein [Methylorubrum aminovorans]|nr:hypothetical protein [Methylorubrum aminovorans]
MTARPAGSKAANTLSALLGRTVYVADDMALGSHDITAAIPAAVGRLGSMGGRLLLPRSVQPYTLTALQALPSNVILEGDGRAPTLISSNFDGDVLRFGDGSTTNENSGLRNISFSSSVPRTHGAFIALRGTYNFKGADVTCQGNVYVCIDVHGGPNAFKIHLDRVQVFNPYVGIRLGFSGGQPADVMLNEPLISGATMAALHFRNVSGFQVRGGDYISNKNAWLMDPGNGQVVNGSQSTDGFLDTSVDEGLLIAPTGTGKVSDVTFTGLWAATNGQSNGKPGIRLKGTPSTIRSLIFNAPRLTNNGGEGFRNEGSAYIDINAPQISFNSKTARNVYSGIHVAAGVSSWSVTGGRSGPGGSFPGQEEWQKYGIEVAPGAGDRITVAAVDLSGNLTGSLSNGATGGRQTIDTIGAPYGTVGRNMGIGTLAPAARLTVTDASLPYKDVAAGAASAQISTGNGAATDSGIRFGVLADMYGWMQCAKPGSNTLPCYINPMGSPIVLGKPAPATSEANGYPYIPVMSGTPTGAPQAVPGMAPLVVDGRAGKLCVYANSAWKCIALQ